MSSERFFAHLTLGLTKHSDGILGDGSKKGARPGEPRLSEEAKEIKS
jgi:hypothetical protein